MTLGKSPSLSEHLPSLLQSKGWKYLHWQTALNMLLCYLIASIYSSLLMLEKKKKKEKGRHVQMQTMVSHNQSCCLWVIGWLWQPSWERVQIWWGETPNVLGVLLLQATCFLEETLVLVSRAAARGRRKKTEEGVMCLPICTSSYVWDPAWGGENSPS